ncbi:ABC transporter substrate-binding protein [Labrys portucalensis]|uniref:ABC transporter substrate-binding protein n=1 Tax=Labrys neptuniae TaxID=376174 RepID=A0ABV6ZHZ0_9HYPH
MNLKFLAGATASFAVAISASSAALAQDKTLYVGMNGGPYEKTFTEAVFPDFEKANGVKIVVVPGTSTDILAKATASKDNPQMHLIFLDDGVMMRAISSGLCEKLQPSPELNEIAASARIKGDMAAGIDMGMTGIGYNKKIFDENGWPAPTSWLDLADPKFKDKLVFQSAATSTYGLHALLMVNRIEGGSEGNVEPGFTKIKQDIAPNVLEFIPSSAKLSEMVQTGEAAIFPLTPTAIGNLKDKGLPVEYVQPKEGSVLLMIAQCVTAKNSEPELSQKLAAYLMSAAAQAKALNAGNIIPSNPSTKASNPVAQSKLDAFNGYMKTVITLDWDAVNAKRPEWNNRWNKTIER